MFILGLTGSIGMGKSTIAERFKEHNIPVLNADDVVHNLYEGEAAVSIENAFPGSVKNGTVDRKVLSGMLLDNPDSFKKLEKIIHPLVRKEEVKFIEKNFNDGRNIVVLEVPLLFETGMDELVDFTIVVSAPEHVRDMRVLKRPGMTKSKLETIKKRQISEERKKSLADYIVDTSGEISESWNQVDTILESLTSKTPEAIDLWDITADQQVIN